MAGDVGILIGALTDLLRGRLPKFPAERFRRYMDPGDTTPNKHRMALAIVLLITGGLGELGTLALSRLRSLVVEDERWGPRWRELLCPDPHEGMYDLADAGLVAAGLDAPAGSTLRDLGLRVAALFGQTLRLSDLVADDGWVAALPGERANSPDGPSRYARHLVYVEIRRRQRGGERLEMRGVNGRPRTLDELCSRAGLNGDTGLWYGAAHWWRQILDAAPAAAALPKPPKWMLSQGIESLRDPRAVAWIEAHPESPLARRVRAASSAAVSGQVLLAGPLALDAPLPARLPLELIVQRWEGGTLAYFEDPGSEEARRAHLTRGSEAARNDPDKVEDVTTAVLAERGRIVKVVLSWKEPRPTPPKSAHVINVTRIRAA